MALKHLKSFNNIHLQNPVLISSILNPKDQLAAFLAPRLNESFDTSEKVNISALALLKMLKHSRSEIPLEKIGILLGSFVDNYTIRVSDVFETPQTVDDSTSETFEEDKGQKEESYEQKMKNKLKDIWQNLNLKIIGWYYSQTGKGLWLSAVAVNRQMNRWRNKPRSIVMVVDPVQSVKEHVSIGAFRCIDLASAQGEEPRETTSFEGYLEKPTTKQLVRGLNKQYYKLPISCKMEPFEQRILESLHTGLWQSPLRPPISFKENDINSLNSIKSLIENAKKYRKQIIEEGKMSYKDRAKESIGEIDPCTFIKQETDKITVAQINQLYIVEVNSITF